MEMDDDTERKKRNIYDEFLIIDREPPAKTSRLSLDTKELPEQWNKAVQGMTLQAFPRLYANETDAARLERAAAFDTVWSTIDAKIKACLESTDAEVFASLSDFAIRHHPSEHVLETTPTHGLHKIPSGLVLAGGINSADHVRTFPNLAAHLRAQGCYVALLQAHDMDRSLGDGISAVMQQFSGENDKKKDKFEHVLEWYKAQTASRSTLAGGGVGGASTAANDPPQDADATAEEGPSNRKRKRATAPAPSTTTAARGTHKEFHNNLDRPLVIIIESVEAVPSDILTDFVTVFSEGWKVLPISLIMGVTTTVAAVHASLAPVFIERTLTYTQFNLATAMSRLDTLVEKVLLSHWPGLLLDGALVSALWEQFMVNYFSPGIIIRGWKDAAMGHFRGEKLSALAALVIDGDIHAAKKKIEEDKVINDGALGGAAAVGGGTSALAERKKVRGRGTKKDSTTTGGTDARTSGGTDKGSGLSGVFHAFDESAVEALMQSWRRWALGIRCMVVAASVAGLTNGYTHWQLYRDALTHNFGSVATGKELLGRLERAVKRLDGAKIETLLDALNTLAAPPAALASEESEEDEKVELGRALEELRAKISGRDITNDQSNGPGDKSLEGPSSGATEIAPTEVPGADPDLAEDETAIAASAAAAGGKRREKYYSKTSRKEALLSKARSQAVTRGGSSARGGRGSSAAAPLQPVLAPADHAAAWLYSWLSETLKQPPTQLPAAKIFTCRDISSLDGMSAVPRESIYTALIHPQLYMPRDNYDEGPSTSRAATVASRGTAGGTSTNGTANGTASQMLGMTGNVDDVCLAYQLFDQDPDCSNVAEWFTSFRAVHEAADKAEEERNRPPGEERKKTKNKKKEKEKPKEKGKRGRPKKKVSTKEDGDQGTADDQDQDDGTADDDGSRGRELAARFSQAAAELQFLGLIKPAKRHARGGEMVVRTMHMPAAMMGDA